MKLMKKKVIACAMAILILLSLLLHFPMTAYAMAEVLPEAELLRQSFQVLEGGAVNSSFKGFEVIEGGLSVANKEAMVSSFGSQIMASAKTLGYNVALAGGVAVTEYTALEVGYRALDAIMDSSAGDGVTQLWLNTFSNCAYKGMSSLETEKAVLTANMLGSLESLLNHHFEGEFELNAGLVGNQVALGSDYFKNATSSGVNAYKALNSSNQATFVFNGDVDTQYMTHYFVNGASYGVISNGLLTLYKANGDVCSISNSSGKCTTSFIMGNTFYGLSTYTNMTSFTINLGNAFKMISGSGIRLYRNNPNTPIMTSVSNPITIPNKPISLPKSITVPLSVGGSLAIANGAKDADVDVGIEPDNGSDVNTSGFWNTLWDWLARILEAIKNLPSTIVDILSRILEAIKNLPSAIIDILSKILEAIKAIPKAILDGISNVLVKVFVPSETVITNTTDLLKRKLPFVTDLYSWVNDLMDIMRNPDQYASNLSFTVDMSKVTDSYWNWGNGKGNALSMDWYMKYKDTVDDIIVGIVWLIFLWNLHGQLPSIISALHNGTYSVANLEYQKYNVETRTKKMRESKSKGGELND